MSKADEIRQYKIEHPDKDVSTIAKDLGLNYATVRHAVTTMNKTEDDKASKSPTKERVQVSAPKVVPVITKAGFEEKVEDFETEASRAGNFKVWCVLCQKPLIAKISGTEIVKPKDPTKDDTYMSIAQARCNDCQVTMNLRLTNFKHKK